MSIIFGSWKNELMYGGTSVETTITVLDDGNYHTHMVYSMANGCRQHIHHYGTHEIRVKTIKLSFRTGNTEKSGCRDPTENFVLRDFTDAEINEAMSLLENEIAFSVNGENLTTTVTGPTGPMKIVYKRLIE